MPPEEALRGPCLDDDDNSNCGGVLGGEVGLCRRIVRLEEGDRRWVGVWLLARRSSRAVWRLTRPVKRKGGRTRRHHCWRRLAAGTAAAGHELLLYKPMLLPLLLIGHTSCGTSNSCSWAHSYQLRHVHLLWSSLLEVLLSLFKALFTPSAGLFAFGVLLEAVGATALFERANGGGDRVLRCAAAMAAARTLPRLLPRCRGLHLLL